MNTQALLFLSDVQVQVMPSGAETALFKEFFFNWLDKYETTGPSKPYIIGKIADVEQIPFDSSTLHDNRVMAAIHNMVDDGSGEVKVWSPVQLQSCCLLISSNINM